MKKNSGFSLIELLVVLSIIGVLSTIVTPKFRNYLAQGKEIKAIATLESLRTASDFYFLENGKSFIEDGNLGEITPAQLERLEPYLSNNAKKLVKGESVLVEIGGTREQQSSDIKYGGNIGFTTKNPKEGGKSNGVNIWFNPNNTDIFNMKGEKWIDL